ncbi:prolyl-tRNA synthetase [Teratosphaeria nubilosa]|uniref:proline--tRNA ligase n=1 Tax=Teratosphaeria nubilosa TaxID=161662 RepID=A0A6G1LG05_9PEZI|nr:prolyl-tRNA synthetase [Teratosphaeria nubilosa]
MLPSNGLKQGFRAFQSPYTTFASGIWARRIHFDGCNRLSSFWTPTQGKKGDDGAQDHLIDAGFLRQAHSGIFHLLPLGLRVQNKIEALIDKHMTSLGASKVSLSSLSSEELWEESGRLEQGRGSEIFRLQDRKEARYLLSPTHEEEITKIVANAVHSYKDLPLRLYQVTRKYRDEARPRQGLLRGREFLMKDLYTFDVTDEQARQTYEDTRAAYSAFLDDLKVQYFVASADSGNMGGNLSHEYHFASPNGEDTIIKCDTCDYSANEEVYTGRPRADSNNANDEIATLDFLSKDRKTWLQVVHPTTGGQELNTHVLKAIYPETDTSFSTSTRLLLKQWMQAQDHPDQTTWPRRLLYDPRISGAAKEDLAAMQSAALEKGKESDLSKINISLIPSEIDGKAVLLTKARDGDRCPQCGSGHLKLHKAVEIGHTFHLGTRYSEPLNLRVTDAENKQVAVSMGCHGIGVSRLLGAVASLLSDSKGLNWPLAIAPFGVIIVPAPAVSKQDEDIRSVYDVLSATGVSGGMIDVAVDDRNQALGWKLKDADLVGYPFIVVIGKGWSREPRTVELQCRRMGVKEDVPLEGLVNRIVELSSKL